MSFVASGSDRELMKRWRELARVAVSWNIDPQDISWRDTDDLLGGEPLPSTPGPTCIRVPAALISLSETVLWHSSPERFHLLYEAIWRTANNQGDPLAHTDSLGRRLHLMAKNVGRDIHKMHAFVRFQELAPVGARRQFAAWFEPNHHVVEPASDFFVRRFGDMDWTIATPDLTAHYRGGELSFSSGVPKPNLPADASQALWATYFANIFNPARIKLAAMRSEMPKKYWKNLPETRNIPWMLAGAEARVRSMHAAGASVPVGYSSIVSSRYRSTLPAVPDTLDTLLAAQSAAAVCRRCNLCEAATQTVWGEGPQGADIMIVGEQPGDEEDLVGRPFVGPAGKLLDRALASADIERSRCYLTNAVKHFKFVARGKRRIHQSPNKGEIEKCRWWITKEIEFVRPRLVVAMGASAAESTTGRSSNIGQRRGVVELGTHGGPVMITWHPAYILRRSTENEKYEAFSQLTADLQQAAQFVLEMKLKSPEVVEMYLSQ